jgi:uncharacterized protein (DUF2252 family)
MKTKTQPDSRTEKAPPALKARPTQTELGAMGKTLRDTCPRSAHGDWKPPANRADPLVLLEESSKGRIAQLLPIRYGRMMHSPFTWYRGAALNMAADLAATPVTGLRAQTCGDCHLLNFGAFATPERHVIFDINDFDETLPGPWEWDLKRLAASFVLACRNNSFDEPTARETAESCARAYREHMAEFAEMCVLDVWHSRIDVESMLPQIKDEAMRKRAFKQLERARARGVMEHDFPQLVATDGMMPQIKDNPPLIYHGSSREHDEMRTGVERAFARYRETLTEDRRRLLDRFELKDYALKVVGVGSVGTYCGVLLFMASEHDPLFLQVKEARASVLEGYAGKSRHANHGERVVNGCRLMQSASDMFLGWTDEAETGRHYYVRQLKDMKIRPTVEAFSASVMNQYAEVCGLTLARAHARSGEPAQISGYLGKSDVFDKAIAKFAAAYADQSESDHAALMKAVHEGRLEVVDESA